MTNSGTRARIVSEVRRWWTELRVWRGYDQSIRPALHIIDDPLPDISLVERDGVVRISTHHCDGIALYAGMSAVDYLALCAMRGLLQWRALALNPLLVPEDMPHDEPQTCLYARCRRHERELALESPSVCDGCIAFYHCLGADHEIIEIRAMLGALHARRPR